MSDILYKCDRRACEHCSPECSHTQDISHAVNFQKFVGRDAYVELSKQETDDTNSLLNPYGKYLTTFAHNHSISISEAAEQPMVKARLDFFNKTGK